MGVRPIVGRFRWTKITIRLPKLYPLGTKVTLIGSNGNKEITATQVATYRGTINYEVVCLLSDRIRENIIKRKEWSMNLHQPCMSYLVWDQSQQRSTPNQELKLARPLALLSLSVMRDFQN